MNGPAQVNVQLYTQLLAAGWAEDDVRRVHSAYELVQSLVSGQRHASGKPFVCHLVGTASVVAADHAPVDVVVAGLCHAAYSHGDFGWGRRGWPAPRARRELTARVGESVAGVVERYWALPFTAATVEEWTDRAQRAELDERERCLVRLRVANDIDNRAFRSEHFRGAPDLLESGDAVVALGEAAGFQALARRLGDVLADERTHAVVPTTLDPTVPLFSPPRSYRMRGASRARRALAGRYRAVRPRRSPPT